MGSTISVDKKAAIVAAASGVLYYALFEKTFESNVFPKNPHWCCIYFGPVEACMRKVVQYSAACEGGCLKGPHGRITPTAYLKQWRVALANPVLLTSVSGMAKFGPGLYDIEAAKLPLVVEILGRHGLPATDGAVLLTYAEHAGVLHELVDRAGVCPWYFIKSTDFGGEVQDWAAYAPAMQKVPAIDCQVYHLAEGSFEPEHWVCHGDGTIKQTGWSYSTIQHLIVRLAVNSEAAIPGSAEDVMRQVRQCVEKQSIAMPHDQVVVLDRRQVAEKWYADNYDRLASKLQLTGDVIRTTVRDIVAADAVRELTHLKNEMVMYPGLGQRKAMVQQDLLAA